MKARRMILVGIVCLVWIIMVLPIGGGRTLKAASEKEPIDVGLVTVLSGPRYLYTVGTKINTKLAVEDVNENGGVNGYPLKLSMADSGNSAEGAVTGYRKLVNSERILACFGPFFDFQYKAVLPVAKQMRCMVLQLTHSETGYVEGAGPWGFRLEGDRNDIAPLGIEALQYYLKLYPKVKKVGIFYQRDVPWGPDQARVWEANLGGLGLTKAGVIDTPYNNPDWAPYVTRMKALNPDGILISTGTDDCIRFVKESQKQGLIVPVFGSVHTCSSSLTAAVGPLMEKMGWVSTQDTWFMDAKNAKIVDRFRVELKKEIPKARMWATRSDRLAYDNVWVVAKAMRDEKVTPKMPLAEARTKIANYLAKHSEFDLPLSGHLKLDPDRHESIARLKTILVKNGDWWVPPQ